MNWALIMAGGSGTRFWPASRKALPKQFLKLWGGKTLIEETCDRVRGLAPKERLEVFAQASKSAWVAKHLKISKNQVVGEPMGRNTAPCAIWAALRILKKDPGAVIAILPSDHFIGKPKDFVRALKTAYEVARQTGQPVTLGIQPDSPHTGYGYLEMQKQEMSRDGFKVYRLKQFHEKPDAKKAAAYLKSGKYLWNAGIFIWKASALVECAEKYLPESVKILRQIVDQKIQGKKLAQYFSRVQSISIDYGLMEPLRGKILTIPVSVGWNDVGSWSTLAKLLPEDRDQNVYQGNIVSVRSRGNFVKASGKPIALVGVQNMVVVDAGDVLLVCPKSETESIRDLVAELQKRGMKAHL